MLMSLFYLLLTGKLTWLKSLSEGSSEYIRFPQVSPAPSNVAIHQLRLPRATPFDFRVIGDGTSTPDIEHSIRTESYKLARSTTSRKSGFRRTERRGIAAATNCTLD